MVAQKYGLALDLIDDAQLMAEYKSYHQNIWPEITKSIKDSGIQELDIYSVSNRMFMIIEADETFSFNDKSKKDASNPKVRESEELMCKFQLVLPWAKAGEKWMLMEKIFELK